MKSTITADYKPMIQNDVTITQKCQQCGSEYGLDIMVSACPACKGRLDYHHKGQYNGQVNKDSNSLWRNFDLIPLNEPDNICSLGEGGSEIIEVEELGPYVNNARVFVMMDSEKNPTGVFKDREASIIMSRCKELGMDNLVFYSTANTGRSYTHYAANMGLRTFLFMPRQCHYKNTKHIKKNKDNFIIYVDDHYYEIAPFARKFAEQNGLNLIAPLQDRNEAYATVAYEQFQTLPKCDYFVQTITSGMGPIGFLKGHKTLVKFGLQQKEMIPRLVCVQSSQMNVMSAAYNSGKKLLKSEDLPKIFPDDLYEPTLNSTNPVNNYPDLYACLEETNGIITDVDPKFVEAQSEAIINAFKKRGITIRTALEKSLLISFAGMIKLARKGKFSKGEIILLMSCGRGKDDVHELYLPDAVINPHDCDAMQLKKKLVRSI